MDNIKDIIGAQYTKLPSEVKNYISSQEWENKVKAIDLKYGLSDETMEILHAKVISVLLCLEKIEDFKTNIEKEHLFIPPQTIEVIADEIIASVFTPIREALENFIRAEEENEPKMAESGEMLKKTDVLSGIENPTPFPAVFEKPGLPATGFVEDKLSKVVTAPKAVGEIKTAPEQKYSQDPYRESVE
ncbi:MAG: hypothetical protein AAB587_00405 [Patescibacteria group bacterium]